MSNMEWIETTGKTVAEAREHALDQLRVDESEIEFEVIEEPKSGLFGRTRGVARVRARIAHKAPRPKTERRKRTKKTSGNGGGRQNGDGASDRSSRSGGSTAPKTDRDQPRRTPAAKDTQQQKESGEKMSSNGDSGRGDKRGNGDGSRSRAAREPMEESRQIEVVEGFLTGILESFGLSAEMESNVDGKDLVTNVKGDGLGLLVGPRLATLEALQELARLSLQREAEGKEYARVTIDVAGIRETRRDSLEQFVKDAAARARDEGCTVVFEEMSSADRKQVHDLAATIDGVKSISEGEDPRRRVALVPDS